MDLIYSGPHPPIAWRCGRDGRAAECEALEKPWARAPWVRIPLPPLGGLGCGAGQTAGRARRPAVCGARVRPSSAEDGDDLGLAGLRRVRPVARLGLDDDDLGL